MSGCGETVNFFLSAWGRNRHLQVPTGLFGGDEVFGLPTYTPYDEHYRKSSSYSTTVSVPNGSSLRSPAAAWYFAGRAMVGNLTGRRLTLVPLASGDVLLSAQLLNTVLQPVQYASIFAFGELVAGSVDFMTTTASSIVVDCDTYPQLMTIGSGPVFFMLRPRLPSDVWPGPVQVISDTRVRLEVDLATFNPPLAGGSLLYLGAASASATDVFGVHDVQQAPNYIFAVDEYSIVAPGTVTSNPSTSLNNGTLASTMVWMQESDSRFIGAWSSFQPTATTVLQVQWPWAEGQNGVITVLVRGNVYRDPPWLPNQVLTVTASAASLAVVQAIGNPVSTYVIPDPTTGWAIVQWNATSGNWIATSVSDPRTVIFISNEQRAADPTWTTAVWEQPSVSGPNVVQLLSPSPTSEGLIVLERRPAAVLGLQSSIIVPSANVQWWKLAEYVFLGWASVPPPTAPTGTTYLWPYPYDQPGRVRVFASGMAGPLQVPSSTGPVLWFVIAFTQWDTTNNRPILPAGTPVLVGDRVLVVDGAGLPIRLVEWTLASTWSNAGLPAVPIENLLVVREGPLGTAAWWYRYTTQPPYTLQVFYDQRHALTDPGVLSQVAWTPPSAAIWPVATGGTLLVVLSRSSDLLYALQPLGFTSNFYSIPALPGSVLPNRYTATEITDGLLGASVRWNRQQPDHAAVRVSFMGTASATPGFLRVNMDMGSPVEVPALAWALVADGLYPSLSLHGSNDIQFFNDETLAGITRNAAPSSTLYTVNTHTLTLGTPLWQAYFNRPGSPWQTGDVDAGTADVWTVRFDVATGRYQRLYVDGSIAQSNADASWIDGHVLPTAVAAPVAFQYYAFVVSVGLLVNTGIRTLEIEEVQPMVVAPIAPPVVSSTDILGQSALLPGRALVDFTLSRSLPPGTPPYLGFVEHWNSFVVRCPFYMASAWAAVRFQSGQGRNAPTLRRATVALTELIVPRHTLIRSTHSVVSILPFMWVFVRHGSIRMVANQAMISHRLIDLIRDQVRDPRLRPPAWIDDRDTMQFHVAVTSGRIPCSASFIGLCGSNTIHVDVTHDIGTLLPEVCCVLPNGEVLDFVMYDEESIPLPMDVMHDDFASITTMFTVQFDETIATNKRTRNA